MSVKCYYHKIDLDGKCSAAIVRRKYPECELIGVDYPDRPDFEKIEPGDTIFVVDFSFEPEDMERLYTTEWKSNGKQSGIELNWIDHHKSALEKAKITPYYHCEGVREIGKAACELTWEYLFPDEPMPEAVRLLGRYDVWDKSDKDAWESEILPFQYAMRCMNIQPYKGNWKKCFHQETRLDDMIAVGRHVLNYEKSRNTAYAEAMAFPVEFEGHKAWAINKALSNSKIFETIKDSHKRPLWILFSYRDGIWKYSLYSAPDSGIDVSEIAVKYGGGGHAGAAGFQSEKYLLEGNSSLACFSIPSSAHEKNLLEEGL